MAILTYTTSTADDEIIVWELARRAKTSKTPPKNAQALLMLEFAHLLRQWGAARKAEAITKLQDDPSSLTANDKTILGIS